LYRRISLRIDELNDFFAQNSQDERSILIKKQGMRLKRAIQQTKAVTEPATAEVEYVAESEPAAHFPRKVKPEKERLEEPEKPNMVEDISGESVVEDEHKSHVFSERGVAEDEKEYKNPAELARSVASMSMHAAKSGDMAILSPSGERFDIGSLYDSEYAAARGSQAVTNVRPGGCIVQFQVRLSEKDYFDVMARRRILQAAQKQQRIRDMKNSRTRIGSMDSGGKFLSTQGKFQPEQTSWKLRETKREKWIKEQGFLRSSKDDFARGKE